MLDDDIDPVDATMIVTFREVLSCIRYFGIKPTDSIAVIGCGPVGLTYIKFLSLVGVKNLVDMRHHSRKAGARRSATAPRTSSTPRRATRRSRFASSIPRAWTSFSTPLGFPSIVNQGMGMIKDRGAVLCYGVPEKEEITIDFSKADYNWRVIYQQMPRKREEGAAHAQVMEWIRSGELNIKDFISDYFDFKDAVAAYIALLSARSSKRASSNSDPIRSGPRAKSSRAGRSLPHRGERLLINQTHSVFM